MDHEPLNQPVETELTRTLDQLTRLRDEVRLQLHLAGMEMTSEFSRAEADIEKAALALAARAEGPRIAALERLRRVEDVLTRIARSIPGGT